MSSSLLTKPVAKTDASPPPVKMPNETVRALVTLWLLFHFLGMALALATDTIMGQSQLLARIKQAPLLNQYIYQMWLDLSYGFSLTNGEQNSDYAIEVEKVYSDGHREPYSIQPEGARGERLEHYQQMAQVAALFPDLETPNLGVAKYLGGALLKQGQDQGVTEIIYRVRRHAPLSMQDAAASDPGQRNPKSKRTYTNLFTASVKLNSTGQPEAIRIDQAVRDVAPVTGPKPSASGSSPAGSTPRNTLPKSIESIVPGAGGSEDSTPDQPAPEK